VGDAAATALGDASADLVLSVFGVIFAPDPVAAVAEIARVTAPTGRVVLSAWIPGGSISDAVRAAQEAVRRATDAPPAAPPFPWHEREALTRLFAPHGFEVALTEERIACTASSPRDYVDQETAHHPLALAGRAALDRSQADALGERLLSIYEAANEDSDGFRVTSRYVVATARRGGG